jgi:flagellar protein FlaG
MQVQNSTAGTPIQPMPKAAESVDTGRKELNKGQPDLDAGSSSTQKNVQPEELLSQIKSLTEDGLYSVRFEKSREFDQLVVKIVDSQTDELIRQVPADEILGVKASLAELRGQIVDTVR